MEPDRYEMRTLPDAALVVTEAGRARERSRVLCEHAARRTADARAACVRARRARRAHKLWAHKLAGGSALDRPLTGLHILLLDDDPSILRAISRFLGSTGARVTETRSASEAFGAFVKERPHVIVTDYAMPDTTGADFLRQVRTCPSEAHAPTPAILFSALPGLGATARVAGFDSYLVKPLEPDVLVSEIVRVARKQALARVP